VAVGLSTGRASGQPARQQVRQAAGPPSGLGAASQPATDQHQGVVSRCDCPGRTYGPCLCHFFAVANGGTASTMRD